MPDTSIVVVDAIWDFSMSKQVSTEAVSGSLISTDVSEKPKQIQLKADERENTAFTEPLPVTPPTEISF